MRPENENRWPTHESAVSADADFSQRIVSAVRRREPAIDFQSANVLNLRGLDDSEVLALAAQEGRVLVSHDLTTMPNHFAKFVETIMCRIATL